MKKIFLIAVILLISEIMPAQMRYISYRAKLSAGFGIDETNSANEADKRRRKRGRRFKTPMFATGGNIAVIKISESAFDDKFHIGLGANAWINLSQSNAINANLIYFLPASQEAAEIKNTSSYLMINLHFQQFIVGNNSEDFGLFATGGFGYIINFNKTETPTYDIDARYTNINLDLGIGAQFNLNFAYLFAEVQGSLGLLKYDVQLNPADGINVPSYFTFRSGLKIPLQF